MTPSIQTKPTIVIDEHGEWIWSRQPTPEQDLAWVRRQHQERDAFVSLARTLRSNAHQYRRFGMADKAAEAWDRARWSIQQAKIRNV